MKENGLKVYMH